ELVEAQGLQVVGAGAGRQLRAVLPDLHALLLGGQPHAVAHELLDRLVAARTAEHEHDGGQPAPPLELLHHVGAAGRAQADAGVAAPPATRPALRGRLALQRDDLGVGDAAAGLACRAGASAATVDLPGGAVSRPEHRIQAVADHVAVVQRHRALVPDHDLAAGPHV